MRRWIGVALLAVLVSCSSKVGHPQDSGYVSRGISGQGQRYISITFVPGDGHVRPIEGISLNEVPLSYNWESGTTTKLESFCLIDVRSERGMTLDSTYYALFIADEFELELIYPDGSVQELLLEEVEYNAGLRAQ